VEFRIAPEAAEEHGDRKSNPPIWIVLSMGTLLLP
jgi:hypothetical protein